LKQKAMTMTGGDPDRGRASMSGLGCSSCHTIPGVKGADAMVGPSLEHIASRSFIGGVLPNSSTNMLRWLQNPPGVDPLTAMPNLHLTEPQARDLAGYLYTLQ
jgi:cytochrome c